MRNGRSPWRDEDKGVPRKRVTTWAVGWTRLYSMLGHVLTLILAWSRLGAESEPMLSALEPEPSIGQCGVGVWRLLGPALRKRNIRQPNFLMSIGAREKMSARVG
jgi:hypothetical protein